MMTRCSIEHEPRETPATRRGRKRLLIAMVITALTMLVEAVGGWLSGSLALISDAGHMFSHLFALSISYIALLIASKPADEVQSYGFYRAEILAALANGLTLIVIVLWIIYSAYTRFRNPIAVSSNQMLIIAVIGLVVNAVTAMLLKSSADQNLNIKSAFLHVLGDLGSSFGVVIAAVIIKLTGWNMIDPIVSVIIALVIGWWSLGLLRKAVHILLQSTPPGLSHEKIISVLVDDIPEVHGVHHIHIWELTTDIHVMTAHLEVEDMPISRAADVRLKAEEILRKRFGIRDANLQCECMAKRRITVHNQ